MKEKTGTMKICSLLLLLCMLLLSGCSRTAPEPAKLQLKNREALCALPGTEFPVVRVALVDREGRACAGRTLLIQTPADGSLICEPAAVTDAGGCAALQVRAGRGTGERRLIITVKDCPAAAPLEPRFFCGMKLSGLDQELAVGTESRPLTLTLVRGDGKPAAGVPVRFALPEQQSGALLDCDRETDAGGQASARIQVGGNTGSYRVTAASDAPDFRFSPVAMRVFGIDVVALALTTLGGLALFIYGMTMMSNGLRHAAGEKLRGILRFFTRNRVIGLLAGIGVTAAIQASGATTVMVVGFVNAGLMNLSQAISIMLGAHIGTTVTAQLVAFKLEALIMPALIIGLILNFLPANRYRGWSETVLGFGLLFFGMNMMSKELKILAEFGSCVDFFRYFNCAPVSGIIPPGAVLGAIGIGLLTTIIIQSSSATSGIVIALAMGGLVDFYTSVALIFGANIGTTITAMIAAIPANRVAKQAALANILCAVLGVLIFGATFWVRWPGTEHPLFLELVSRITGGDVFAETPQNLPRHIANAHSLFNVLSSLLFLPFVGLIAKLTEKILPADTKVKNRLLEPHLLKNPAIALEQTVHELRRMLAKSCKMVNRAAEAFIAGKVDEEKFSALERKEKRIDRMQFEITDYLTRIMQHKLNAAQANVIPLLMHCTNDAERIADHTEDIVTLVRRLKESELTVSGKGREELEKLRLLFAAQTEAALSLLGGYDFELVKQAAKIKTEIAALADHFEDTHIQRLREQTCNAESGVVFIEMLSEFVKVSDRLANIVDRSGLINRNALGFYRMTDAPVAGEDEE